MKIVPFGHIHYYVLIQYSCINAGLTYKAISGLQKGMKVGKISRADVAQFLITEAESPKMLYQYVALTN